MKENSRMFYPTDNLFNYVILAHSLPTESGRNAAFSTLAGISHRQFVRKES